MARPYWGYVELILWLAHFPIAHVGFFKYNQYLEYTSEEQDHTILIKFNTIIFLRKFTVILTLIM